MPNWKKVVVSGSDATLNSLYVATDVTASNNISASFFIGDGSQLINLPGGSGAFPFVGDAVITGSLLVSGSGVSGSFSGSFQGKLGPISNTTYRLTSGTYTASAADYRIGVKYTLTGSVSIQLPLISNVGEIEYKFKDEEGNAKGNNITITPSGSNLIDGSANTILNRNYTAISLYNDGVSNWFVE